MVTNTRVAFGTAAYVPYAVGCYTRTLQPVPGFHEFWSQRKTTLSPEFAAVIRSAQTALRGRSNYVSGHDASIPNATHG
ncbi:hypothetical protein, partial [Lacticaseibacillus pantheris]